MGGQIVNFTGNCQTNKPSAPIVIDELCQLIDLTFEDREQQRTPYDTSKIDITVEIERSYQQLYPYDVRIVLKHKESAFPAGTFFFDFLFVWYVGDDQPLLAQKIDGFIFFTEQV